MRFCLNFLAILFLTILIPNQAYGEPNSLLSERRPRQSSPDIRNAPDLCEDPKIDAITKTQDGKSYVFKGEYYWRILAGEIADGYPQIIRNDWGGLPGHLDAALSFPDGKTVFFQGSKYWRFINKRMENGYPKDISVGFKDIPNNLDAALLWSGNGKPYFFKGGQYWGNESRLNPPVSEKYPKPIATLVGLPDNLDAAFQWENGWTYFFKGHDYYRFNDDKLAVDIADPSYPRPIATWWFGCKEKLHWPKSVGTTTSSASIMTQSPVKGSTSNFISMTSSIGKTSSSENISKVHGIGEESTVTSPIEHGLRATEGASHTWSMQSGKKPYDVPIWEESSTENYASIAIVQPTSTLHAPKNKEHMIRPKKLLLLCMLSAILLRKK